MRATLDWSHELLSVEEQNLFRRLAIFAGGCTVDAAEYVGGPGGDGSKSAPLVIDLIADLVDKSLLRTADDLGEDRRFGMLETIREYGLERLAEVGEEDEVRRRHLGWCLELAEHAEPELTGAQQQRWFARLDIEHDNLRAALGWAIARHDAESATRLAGTLHRFWNTRGHYEEGRRWLEAALAIDSGDPSAARGYALNGAGVLAWYSGDFDRAEALWQEMLTLFSALGDRRYVAYAHGNLGLIGDAREDYAQATASYEAALTIFRELGDQTYISFMLGNLGLIGYFEGDYPRATDLLEESLAMARALGDHNSVAMNLGNLGLVAFAQGAFDRALALQREALALWPLLTNKPWLARAMENFALIAAATDEPEHAARLFGVAAALRTRLGASLPPNDRAFNQRYIGDVSEALGEAGFAKAWDEGEAMSEEQAVDYALRYDLPRIVAQRRSS
jgi:tetratricopeptide (TPR) repeat protein